MSIRNFFATTPWLAIGAPLETLGTQLDKPYSTGCFVVGAFCIILGGMYHVNERRCGVANVSDSDAA